MLTVPMTTPRFALEINSTQPASALRRKFVWEVDRLMNHHQADLRINKRLHRGDAVRRAQKRLFTATIGIEHDRTGSIKLMHVFRPSAVHSNRLNTHSLCEKHFETPAPRQIVMMSHDINFRRFPRHEYDSFFSRPVFSVQR